MQACDWREGPFAEKLTRVLLADLDSALNGAFEEDNLDGDETELAPESQPGAHTVAAAASAASARSGAGGKAGGKKAGKGDGNGGGDGTLANATDFRSIAVKPDYATRPLWITDGCDIIVGCGDCFFVILVDNNSVCCLFWQGRYFSRVVLGHCRTGP